jgi:predicted small integral membrane protein
VYLSKDRWSEVFFLTAICSFYMPTSWVYSTLYLSAGALFFLKDRFTEQKATDKLFAALFGAIFTVPIWFYFVGENPGTWVCLMAYLLWAITFIRCIVNVMALKTHNGQIR